jgi:hypothetical protein
MIRNPQDETVCVVKAVCNNTMYYITSNNTCADCLVGTVQNPKN